MQALIVPFINLIILIALLVYFTRKPLADFVGGRHTYYRDEVKRVGDQLATSREKYEEFSAKLKAIDAEISAMRSQARSEGEATKMRIAAEAQKLSGTIVSDARASAGGIFDELRSQLRNEFSLRVVERAEKILRERLTGADLARIRKEFSSQVAEETAS